jgi:predicted Zn-dependent protease
MFERLAAAIELDAGKPDTASAMLESALIQHPNSVGLQLLRIDVALQRGEFDQAVTQIEALLRARAADPALYQRLARAYSGLDKTGLSHWATGEQYSLLGGWRSALEQFRLARRDQSMDFYRLSQVDARIAEMQRAIREENEARQRAGTQ